MSNLIPTRIPGVPSLVTTLPKGAEGGKEFGRLIDLLLHNDFRRKGLKFSVFNDESGDYKGLDAFAVDRLRKQGNAGYQYKFYPSPFNPNQRSEIEASVKIASMYGDQTKITDWTLVTPDDLTETNRKGGGDVTWFENLKQSYPKLKIDHIGHTKIIDLFLQTPHLCLRYYPVLVNDGESKRNNIDQARVQYDDNLRQRCGNIEFIGMSVYKEEATRGVPIEHIYIPLAVISENASDVDDNTPRIDPLTLLSPGRKSVILGDPGSGKSTLLSFLSLSGLSKNIQSKFGSKEDFRLPIIVTLRRYADALKKDRNISIVDFIVANVRADFNIPYFTQEMLLYYLDGGQTIVLFDGLDELSTTSLKRLVKERVESLNTSFPGNTIVITSRIVGYEAAARLNEKSFAHFKLARLRLPEMETFIGDWYKVRLENELERQASISDLVRIISNPESGAIRDLARNPLLLTIVALVHRIDAVLPDERVVLYQKCTETLLNTWHKWKFRDEDDRVSGRIERRNRHRVEAIAHWMQCRNTSTTRSRAVATYDEILNFLGEHIRIVEKWREGDEAPEDQAEKFLEFVRSRTGLLIEAGDQLYSFVHLTFQEYLTATYLTTRFEPLGINAMWDQIGANFSSSRWHEVGRLLVASFRSDESQRLFVEKLIEHGTQSDSYEVALLIGGLLIDAIAPAEEHAQTIMDRLISVGGVVEDQTSLRNLVNLLRLWSEKSLTNKDLLQGRLEHRISMERGDKRLQVMLLGATVGMILPSAIRTRWQHSEIDDFRRQSFEAFVSQCRPYQKRFAGRLEILEAVYSNWLVESPVGNLIASASVSFLLSGISHQPARALFRQQMIALGALFGPHGDNFTNLIGLSYAEVSDANGRLLAGLKNEVGIDPIELNRTTRRPIRLDGIGTVIAEIMSQKETGDLKSDTYGYMIARLKKALSQVARESDKHHSFRRTTKKNERVIAPIQIGRDTASSSLSSDRSIYWRQFVSQDRDIQVLVRTVVEYLGLKPSPHWIEAIRICFIPMIPKKIAHYLDSSNHPSLIARLRGDDVSKEDVYWASWLMLLDVWLWTYKAFERANESDFEEMSQALKQLTHPEALISTCLRDLALGNVASGINLQSKSLSDPDVRKVLADVHWISLEPEKKRTSRQERLKRQKEKSV